MTYRLTRRVAAGFVALLLLVFSNIAQADLQFRWQDKFSKREKAMLEGWLEETHAHLEKLVGPLPFDISIRMYRADGSSGPVPWANTRRGARQGVNFYVNPKLSLNRFRADWTAPHELSHLIIPYVGEQYSWFAEGFASYMQFKVMQQIGVIDEREAQRRYHERYMKAQRRYNYDTLPFADAAPRLRAERQYPTMYWGGALYFRQVEEALLRERETDLVAVLSEYVACCRLRRVGVNGLVQQLDALAGGDIFQRTLEQFHTQPGFPTYTAR